MGDAALAATTRRCAAGTLRGDRNTGLAGNLWPRISCPCQRPGMRSRASDPRRRPARGARPSHCEACAWARRALAHGLPPRGDENAPLPAGGRARGVVCEPRTVAVASAREATCSFDSLRPCTNEAAGESNRLPGVDTGDSTGATAAGDGRKADACVAAESEDTALAGLAQGLDRDRSGATRAGDTGDRTSAAGLVSMLPAPAPTPAA